MNTEIDFPKKSCLIPIYIINWRAQNQKIIFQSEFVDFNFTNIKFIKSLYIYEDWYSIKIKVLTSLFYDIIRDNFIQKFLDILSIFYYIVSLFIYKNTDF